MVMEHTKGHNRGLHQFLYKRETREISLAWLTSIHTYFCLAWVPVWSSSESQEVGAASTEPLLARWRAAVRTGGPLQALWKPLLGTWAPTSTGSESGSSALPQEAVTGRGAEKHCRRWARSWKQQSKLPTSAYVFCTWIALSCIYQKKLLKKGGDVGLTKK